MQTLTQADFVRQIDDFLARHDMKPSRLGREATGEPALIDSIKSGKRSPTLATVERLADYMRRKDEEAATRAKLDAPLDELPPPSDAETELPFGAAPVNATGASSPTSFSTTARPRSPAERDSCRCSTTANPSSCAAEADAK